MTDPISTLESAISDVGYWRWWAEALPEVFQVEFGGVQLYFPPLVAGRPPNSVVALRFHEPSVVAFLTAEDARDLPVDWRTALHADKLKPFSVDHERFTVSSEDTLRDVLVGCRVEFAHGSEIGAPSDAGSVLLAFRAQQVGLIVRAKRMAVVGQPGVLEPAQIVSASEAWWEYWREYWRRRDSDSPLPKDYACEVTIPLK